MLKNFFAVSLLLGKPGTFRLKLMDGLFGQATCFLRLARSSLAANNDCIGSISSGCFKPVIYMVYPLSDELHL
jgi:hypothetical protein